MGKERYMYLFIATVLIGKAQAASQQAALPAPNTADNSPSLAVTMQFIQEKLLAFGNVEYQVGTENYGFHEKKTVSNVVADPATCSVRSIVTLETKGNDWNRSVNTFTVALKDVDSFSNGVEIVSIDSNPPLNLASKTAIYYIRLMVPTRTVAVQGSEQTSSDGRKFKKPISYARTLDKMTYRVSDAEIGERLAAAFKHAIALCAAPPPPTVDNRKKPGDPF